MAYCIFSGDTSILTEYIEKQKAIFKVFDIDLPQWFLDIIFREFWLYF